MLCLVFFFNDTAPTEIYTLSLHDALPIFCFSCAAAVAMTSLVASPRHALAKDRKSTRLNSSHLGISYAVFCLKKKNMMNSGESSIAEVRCAVQAPGPGYALASVSADAPQH